MRKIGYYPNTRTDLEFYYSFRYVQLFGKTDAQNNVVGAETKGFKGTTGLSINYYISPKVRFGLWSQLYYIWLDSKDNTFINFNNLGVVNYKIPNSSQYIVKDKEFNYYLQIGFKYSIF